jgi:hypothetical protein
MTRPTCLFWLVPNANILAVKVGTLTKTNCLLASGHSKNIGSLSWHNDTAYLLCFGNWQQQKYWLLKPAHWAGLPALFWQFTCSKHTLLFKWIFTLVSLLVKQLVKGFNVLTLVQALAVKITWSLDELILKL